MPKNSDRIYITTPAGIAKYPRLTTPDTKFNKFGDYKVTVVLNEEDPKAVKFREEIEAAEAKAHATGTARSALEASREACQDFRRDDRAPVLDFDRVLVLLNPDRLVRSPVRYCVVDEVAHGDAEGVDVDRREKRWGCLRQENLAVCRKPPASVVDDDPQRREKLDRFACARHPGVGPRQLEETIGQCAKAKKR